MKNCLPPVFKKIEFFGFVFFALFDVLLFAVATINPGLGVLDGHVNVIDHQDIWMKLDPVSYVVYWLGDMTCHQMTSRSLIFEGGQVPFCIRDTFLFVGTAIGFLIVYCTDKVLSRRLLVLAIVFAPLTLYDWCFKHFTGIDIIQLAGFTGFVTGILAIFCIHNIVIYWHSYLSKKLMVQNREN